MKKLTFLLSFLFVVLGLSAQTNLVQNPSFEDGFTNWTKGPSTSYTEPTIATSGGQDGASYAAYSSPTATTGFYQEIAVTAGKSYTVSFWYKATGDGTDARIWSMFKDAEGTTVYLAATNTEDPLRNNNKYLPTATDWTQHSVDFVVPDGAVTFQLAVRAYKGESVSVGFDNFSLIETGGTANPTLAVNPTSLDFGNVNVGATATKQVTVSGTNLTGAPTYTISGTGFTASGTLNTTGGTIDVTYAPTAEGAATGTLTITGDGKTATVALSGSSGTTPPPSEDAVETFETQEALTGTYADGSFESEVSGVTVNYVHSRDESTYAIDGKGIMLRRADEPSSVEFVIPAGGVGTFSFDYRKAFTGASERILAVVVNGEEKFQTPPFGAEKGEDPTVHKFSETINAAGAVTVKITYPEGTKTGNRQTIIDNVSWTSYPATGLSKATLTDAAAWTANGKVMLNATAGEVIEVYNVAGQKVVSRLATDGLNEVAVQLRGVAIVKVGNRISKVVL